MHRKIILAPSKLVLGVPINLETSVKMVLVLPKTLDRFHQSVPAVVIESGHEYYQYDCSGTRQT